MTDSEQPNTADKAIRWWHKLVALDGDTSRGSRRAALARLRRADGPVEVMLVPEALHLIGQCPPQDADSVAVLLGILAHVRESNDLPIARALGRKQIEDADSATLSEGRFRRLMRVSKEDLLDPMRRLVQMAKGSANVRDLSYSVLYWNDAEKKRWISDYYGVWQDRRDDSTKSIPGIENTSKENT